MFSYKYFVLRPHLKQLGKFETKDNEGIFIGYPVTKDFKDYNLRTKIIMESINVSFVDKNIKLMKILMILWNLEIKQPRMGHNQILMNHQKLMKYQITMIHQIMMMFHKMLVMGLKMHMLRE